MNGAVLETPEEDAQKSIQPEFLTEQEATTLAQTNTDDAESLQEQEENVDEDNDVDKGGIGATERTSDAAKLRLRNLETNGAGNNPASDKGEQESTGKRAKRLLWGTKRRRRTTVGTGIIGLLIAGLTGGSIFFSGPFELIHIAQFLQKAHFSQQEDASDGRVGKLYRFLRSGGDAGETRLGYLGSKYKTQMLSDLKKIGLKPVYDGARVYKGFEIDTKNPKSPYIGLDEDGVRARLAEKGVTSGISTTKAGTIRVTTNGYFGGDGSKASLKLLTKDMGYKGISSALRWRILAKYGLATWHPLKKLDAKISGKLVDTYAKWKEERTAKYKTGVEGIGVNADGAHTETTGEDGKTTETPASDTDKAAAEAITGDTEKSSSALKQLAQSKTAGIAGGIAGAQALVCGLRMVADNIGEIRYNEVAKPLMRMSMDAVTSGNQTMSNKDIDLTVTSFVAKSYKGLDPDTGKMTSWDQAESIQAEAGKSGKGVSAPEEIRGLSKGIPTWLTWTQDSAVDATCSTAAQVGGGVLSVTLGVLSGGIISTASGLLTGILLVPKAIDAAANFLAGEAVDVAATGAKWGNYVNYGARLSANVGALQSGAGELTSSEELALKEMVNEDDMQDFRSKSFAYRMFDLNDNRTFASALLDKSQVVAPSNIASMFVGLATSIVSAPSMLVSQFGTTTNAATTYDYGFAKYGFSEAELNSSAVEDPYANADDVAVLLDGPNGNTYIDKAATCFGVKIEKGSEGWDVIPETDVNVFNGEYEPKGCRDETNVNWLKVRFFIFDTGVFEGLACYKGDDKSCENNGATGAAAAADSSTSTEAPAGSINVASFNICHSHDDKCPDTLSRLENSADVIKSNHLDVVGLQEARPDQQAIILNDRYLGSGYSIWPEDTKGAGFSPNAVVYDNTKFTADKKASKLRSIEYTLGKPTNDLVELHLNAEGGGKVIFLSTHDPANVRCTKPGGSKAVCEQSRRDNARTYVDLINTLHDENPGVPIFLVGDFNSPYVAQPDWPSCIIEQSPVVDDAWFLFKHPGQTNDNDEKSCLSNRPMGSQIDRIYASDDVKISEYWIAQKGFNNNGSDRHDTIMATVEFAGAPTDTPAAASSSSIPALRNFRDASTTSGNGVLRTGVLYRSDQLNHLTIKGNDALAKLLTNKGTVIDVRTKEQRAADLDPDIAGVKNIWIPIDGLKDQKEMVTDATRRKQLAEVFRTAANADGPVLIHCMSGKDRTGWIVAMIMYMNDATDSQVMTEYMKSNDAKNNGVVEEAWLNSGLGKIRDNYGPKNAMYHYWTDKNGLGLSDADIAKIKQKFGA